MLSEMTPESTGSATKSTEKWEVSLPRAKNTEDLEPKVTKTIKRDLPEEPTTEEETLLNSEDTDD